MYVETQYFETHIFRFWDDSWNLDNRRTKPASVVRFRHKKCVVCSIPSKNDIQRELPLSSRLTKENELHQPLTPRDLLARVKHARSALQKHGWKYSTTCPGLWVKGHAAHVEHQGSPCRNIIVANSLGPLNERTC